MLLCLVMSSLLQRASRSAFQTISNGRVVFQMSPIALSVRSVSAGVRTPRRNLTLPHDAPWLGRALGSRRSYHTNHVSEHTDLSFGDFVIVKDDKDRHKLVKLKEGGEFGMWKGKVTHESIVEAGLGSYVLSTNGKDGLHVMRVTLETYTLLMTRSATVTYPKDASIMISMADIQEGDCVLDAGTGSGSMLLHLSKGVGGTGHVYTCDVREGAVMQSIENCTGYWRFRKEIDYTPSHVANRAMLTAEDGYCTHKNVTFAVGSAADRVSLFYEAWKDNHPHHAQAGEHTLEFLDGVMLDMMEPWLVMGELTPYLRVGRSFCLYVPNVTQALSISQFVEKESDCLMFERCHLVNLQDWEIHYPYLSRPKHRQKPHTAFLIEVRKTQRS